MATDKNQRSHFFLEEFTQKRAEIYGAGIQNYIDDYTV
jgi:hypothetical protein